jgi:4-amino-4-deoxy-L-arabinose transferase-like glycosyltransferase
MSGPGRDFMGTTSGDAGTTSVLGWQPFAVIVIVLGVHFLRLGTLPLRGEETRWATVAIEMLRSGDWVVPTQQGLPFLSRPPLGSWLIAASGSALGDFSTVAVRLPTACATLLTCLGAYFYTVGVSGWRRAGLAAGIGYATMGHVLQLGQLAESDAVFTLFLAGSLLTWHLAYTKGNLWAAWGLGYALAALATLTKGPQGPTYFLGSVCLYLLVRRDWWALLSWAHALGLLAFAAILLSWEVPFVTRLGWPALREIWSGDTLLRFQGVTPLSWAASLLGFPIVLLACAAPWSLFLGTYLRRDVREALRPVWPSVLFLLTCIALTLPSCWMIPNTRGRYFLPMYPVMAVLAGLAIDRVLAAELGSAVHRRWTRFASTCAGSALIGALIVALAGVLPVLPLRQLQQSGDFLAWYLLAVVVLAGVALASASRRPRVTGSVGMLAIAGLVGVSFTGVGLNVNLMASEDTASAVADLKGRLPDDVRLIGFGEVHHVFAYHYKTPIEARPLDELDRNEDVDYFCIYVTETFDPRPKLPFAWEQVARVSCERYRRDRSRFDMIIGRRLDVGRTADRASASNLR